MSWLLTALICAVLIEIVCRLPLASLAAEIREVARKSQHTVLSRAISDHWKEKALLVYAGRLLSCSLRLAMALAGIGAVLVSLTALFDYLGANCAELLLSWTGILYSTVVATAYFALRRSVG